MNFFVFLALCLTVEEASLAIKVLLIWVIYRLHNLQTAINRHNDSKVHKEKDLSFWMLGTIDVKASLYNAQKAGAHNKKVQYNLEILVKLVIRIY